MKSGKYLLSLVIFGVIVAYTILRYNVFGRVEYRFIPLYITNKIFAFSSLIYIGISYILGPLTSLDARLFESKLSWRRYFGLLGFAFSGVHILISLILIDPYFYPALYHMGRLTFFGQLHFIFGVLAFSLFSLVAASSFPNVFQTLTSGRWRALQRLGYIGLLLVLGHVITLGITGWLDKTEWPGNLVPISLISSNFILIILLLKIFSLFWGKHKA